MSLLTLFKQTVQMNIGNAIKQIRKEKGLTQKQLSSKSGVSQTSLSLIEKGQTQAGKETLEKIAIGLGVKQSIIMIHAIERSDVPANKVEVFDAMFPSIKEMLKGL